MIDVKSDIAELAAAYTSATAVQAAAMAKRDARLVLQQMLQEASDQVTALRTPGPAAALYDELIALIDAEIESKRPQLIAAHSTVSQAMASG